MWWIEHVDQEGTGSVRIAQNLGPVVSIWSGRGARCAQAEEVLLTSFL